MNATPQRLSAVPLPGLTLDTLGLYLAALGLLRILSREWPSIRGCWRNGIFHIIAAKISIESINEYLLSLQDADWPEFEESWKKEADQTEKNRKSKSASLTDRSPTIPLLLYRTELPEDKLINFDTHIVVSRSSVKNPLLKNPGGQRDPHKNWRKEVLADIGNSSTRENSLQECLTRTGQGKVILKKWNSANWFPYANKIYNYADPSRKGSKVHKDGGTTSWSVALAVKGLEFFSGSLNRRLSSRAKGMAAFPFVTQSAAPLAEEDCGRTVTEFWAPVWFNPRTVSEASALFQNARAEVGTTAAQSAGAFAAAIISKGINFGIGEFKRFVLSHSTAEKTHEFVLTATLPISSQHPATTPEAMRRIVATRNKLPSDKKTGRGKWKYAGLRGRIDRALIALAEATGEELKDLQVERSWQLIDEVFVSLAKVDRNKAFREKGVRFELLPLDWLAWLLERTTHQRTEIRLALAVASLCPRKKQANESQNTDKAPQRFLAYRLGSERVRKGRYWQIPKDLPLRRVWSPKSLTDNLIALGKRRLFESSPEQAPPFQSEISASVEDALHFLSQGTDDEALGKWIDRFSLFNWSDNRESKDLLQKWVRKPDLSELNDADAMLYGFFRPLFDFDSSADFDSFALRRLQNAEQQVAGGHEANPNVKIGRLVPIVSALDRGEVAAAWELASSAYRAERIALADFQPDIFSHKDPKRLLASILFPVSISNRGLTKLFERWQSPSNPNRG